MNKAIITLALILLTLWLGACSSTPSATPTPKAPSQQQQIERIANALYLIGNFNLWTHNRQSQLIKIHHNRYAASVKLEQNQRYEFMFAAKDSSRPHSNCGYLHQQTLSLDQKVVAQCNNVVLENFVFMPKKTAIYEFFIDFNTLNRPLVYVQQAY